MRNKILSIISSIVITVNGGDSTTSWGSVIITGGDSTTSWGNVYLDNQDSSINW